MAVVPRNGDIIAISADGGGPGRKAPRVLKQWEGTGAIPKGWQCWDGATPEPGVDPNQEQGFYHVVLGPPASGSHGGLVRHTNRWIPQISHLRMKGAGPCLPVSPGDAASTLNWRTAAWNRPDPALPGSRQPCMQAPRPGGQAQCSFSLVFFKYICVDFREEGRG